VKHGEEAADSPRIDCTFVLWPAAIAKCSIVGSFLPLHYFAVEVRLVGGSIYLYFSYKLYRINSEPDKHVTATVEFLHVSPSGHSAPFPRHPQLLHVSLRDFQVK
jgi:hypothetical protein